MAVINILNKIFAGRFYVQNTGFFLLLFYLLFGIVPGGQLVSYHLSLMEGIIHANSFLVVALVLWLLYHLKCMWYVLGVLNNKEYNFLYQSIGHVTPGRMKRDWWMIHISIYAPVLIYSSGVMVLAIKEGKYLTAFVILCFNVLVNVWAVHVYQRQLQRPNSILFYHRWQQWLNRSFYKPLPLYFIYDLAVNRTRALFVTKLLSCLALIATFTLMEGEPYDIRVVITGLLIALLLHCIVVFEHRHFEDQYLIFTRTLPIPLWKRYGTLCLTYACLLLPEFGLIIIHTLRDSNWDWLLMIVLAISALALFRAILYFASLDQDRYLRWVFIIFCALLFTTLAYWYIGAIIAIQLLAFGIFAIRYYRYEPQYEQVQ